MKPLDRTLRGDLEDTVKKARDAANAGARAALMQLGVGGAQPFDGGTDEERDLRRRLRIHGRQLGDVRSADRTQGIDCLAEEVAYEHWHRMLFARFLAENNLLMYPDPDDPVPVTLQECDDLAADEGVRNGWELAARFATRMLPQIFRVHSPVFELALPPEHEQKLERLLADLPVEVFHASDSLGWVYQFWQAKRKDEVNASEVKIGARELPAVTQLFTEPYMVAFLLDNALGAWWAKRRLSGEDLKTADSEDELRRRASIPGVPLEYLRFVKGDDGAWTPAAGTFDGWPERLGELKVLDPCCGSGHFLVAVFSMLVPMRMELEKLSVGDAVDVVLRENLHGLEIDPRCVELAAFALALAAWRTCGGYRVLPSLHVACSGLSVGASREEWQRLADGNRNLKVALGWMHDAFRDAPVLGSLLNPAKAEASKLDLFGVTWEDLSRSLDEALERDQSDEDREAGVAAQGLARAAMMLAGQYHWVVTNVPYLARGRQVEVLRAFCERHHAEAKQDLATAFLDRCLSFLRAGGATSVVLPQNWLFLTSYKRLRQKLLQCEKWQLLIRLGPGAFETVSGEVVKAILLSVGQRQPGVSPEPESDYHVHGLDVSMSRTAEEKALALITSAMRKVNQQRQLGNPDARVALEDIGQAGLLSEYADSYLGLGTGDLDRFVRQVWELGYIDQDWAWMQTSPEKNLFDGRFQIVAWDHTICRVRGMCQQHRDRIHNQDQSGQQAWRKTGVAVGLMRQLPVSLYFGDIFDKNIASLVPIDNAHLAAIWSFCASPEYNKAVRRIDQKVNVMNATLAKVPFDLDHWTRIAAQQYPHGLPAPYSNDPTQWIFHGHPCGNVVFGDTSRVVENAPLRADSIVLQVAVARLLGYRWPAELDTEMELAAPQRDWVKRCDNLLGFADKDGIVCIPSVRGESSAADRLLNLLSAAYGKEWRNDRLAELLKEVGHAGKTLESWIRDAFFAQHCATFQQRPFIWHVWDGLRDGFSVLLNYHRLDRKNLELLIYTYLGDWIKSQKRDQENGVDGAQERYAAALTLQRSLELIRDGESPYDVFVRWKSIQQQAVGWDPDLNDGVRLNIRPFMSVPDVKATGAGVLRVKPRVDWKKDRGKDVESAPWYQLGPQYWGNKGDRINDHHLTLKVKQEAREAVTCHS